MKINALDKEAIKKKLKQWNLDLKNIAAVWYDGDTIRIRYKDQKFEMYDTYGKLINSKEAKTEQTEEVKTQNPTVEQKPIIDPIPPLGPVIVPGEKVIESTFTNKLGETVRVSGIIGKEDCWAKEFQVRTADETGEKKYRIQKRINWILTHDAVEKLAAEAGISPTYDKSTYAYEPKYDNELNHVMDITIKCCAVKGSPGVMTLLEANKSPNDFECYHSDFTRFTTMRGEASRISASNKGRGYLAWMAEKRGYDRAVIRHLQLDSVYSEIEAEVFSQEVEEEKSYKPGDPEFEKISIYVNAIINAKSPVDLLAAQGTIKLAVTTLNEKQLTYLRVLYRNKYAEMQKLKF